MDPKAGAEIHRCACNASPQLDDETAAEDGCEYGVPPIEDVLRWLDHRLQGALMPGAERMYRAIRYYLGEATALSTLQAENEKLRAELEQVKAERDAAIKDMELIVRKINDCNIKLDDGTTVSSLELGRCHVCKHEETSGCDDGGCIFEWRGQKED